MIAYATFIKHASKVTKAAGEARPALKGIYHRALDGSLIATDSHRLYQAIGVYSSEKSQIIDPVTGELIEGNYPETDRLIPTQPKATFTISNIGKISKLAKLLWEAGRYPENLGDSPSNKKGVLLKITQREGKVWLELPENKAMKASLQIGSSDEEIKLTINAGFLFEALDMFQDVGINDATVEYNGSMRPLVFRQENLLALLLPVRVF